MSVVIVRVDARLVHGQVVETWLPALAADAVRVLDAEAAENRLARLAMRMALPDRVGLEVQAPAAVDWEALHESLDRTFVLVRDVNTAVSLAGPARLAERRVPLNVGVVQHGGDRREITPGVHLSGDEIDALTRLGETGIAVEVRGLPSHSPLSPAEVRERFERRRPGGAAS